MRIQPAIHVMARVHSADVREVLTVRGPLHCVYIFNVSRFLIRACYDNMAARFKQTEQRGYSFVRLVDMLKHTNTGNEVESAAQLRCRDVIIDDIKAPIEHSF